MKHVKIKIPTLLSILFLATFLFISCSDDAVGLEKETEEEETLEDPDFEPTDWTSETHSKSADPNFDEVFDNTQVKRFDFVISESNWTAMLDDMTSLYGTFGQNSGGPGGGGLIDVDEDPIFVPGDVFYNGKQWYKVGLRFKGNSSLQSSWQAGILKLAFKMDFDEYEDDYPQIDNQRFYGFKKIQSKKQF